MRSGTFSSHSVSRVDNVGYRGIGGADVRLDAQAVLRRSDRVAAEKEVNISTGITKIDVMILT